MVWQTAGGKEKAGKRIAGKERDKMKKWNRYTAACMVSGLVLSQIAGCGQGSTVGNLFAAESPAEQDAGKTEGQTEYLSSSKTAADCVTAQLGEGGQKTVEYLEEDLETGWGETDAARIVFENSNVAVEGAGAHTEENSVVIEKAGTYVVSGALANGQIRIEAGEGELVHLVLQGVTLSNETTSPIYAPEKCKLVLTLAEGTTNVISDGSQYVYETEGEDEPDASIFTKGDLTINGNGRLEVTGNYQNGIRSKGSLKIVSGDILVDAREDGVKGRDAVIIRDGNLDIRSGKDGIKSNNDEDEEKGYIWIDGGEILIAAEDDGIQAETALIVREGRITITESQEALAGKTVDILGGQIRVNALDDGINAAASVATEQEKMQDQDGVYARIAGGELWINAWADGIDSNGDLYMEGGTLYLSGPESNGDGILDYNGNASISGGTLVAAGSSGMMQTFGNDSTQPYLVVYYTEAQKAGTTIQLTDASGQELLSYAPEKEFRAAIISSPQIALANTYSVTTGEETIAMEVTDTMMVYGTAAGGMGENGGHGGMGRGQRGGRPDAPMPRGEMPEGEVPEGRKPRGEMPEGEMPEGGKPRGEMPEGGKPEDEMQTAQ